MSRRFRVRIQWEPRDLWIGVYWKVEEISWRPKRLLTIWVCLVPCCPIVLQFRFGEWTPLSRGKEETG